MGLFYKFEDEPPMTPEQEAAYARSARKAIAFPYLYGTQPRLSTTQQAAWRALWADYINGKRDTMPSLDEVAPTRHDGGSAKA